MSLFLIYLFWIQFELITERKFSNEVWKQPMLYKFAHFLICAFHAWRVSGKRTLLLLHLIQYHGHGGETLRLEMVSMIHCVPKVKRILREFPPSLETNTGLVSLSFAQTELDKWCLGSNSPTMKSFSPFSLFVFLQYWAWDQSFVHMRQALYHWAAPHLRNT